jgi:hypothetical protein
MGARFAPNVPQAWKSFHAHPMEALGDVGQVEGHFGPFGDSINLEARYMHVLRQMYHRLRMVLLGDVGQVDAHFSLCGDCINLDAR